MIRYIRFIDTHNDRGLSAVTMEVEKKTHNKITDLSQVVMAYVCEPYSIVPERDKTTHGPGGSYLKIEASKEEITLLLLGTSNFGFFEFVTKEELVKDASDD